MKYIKNATSGQSLVEMIVIIGVVVLLATGIVAGTTTTLGSAATVQTRSEALSYAQAGIELVRAVRDAGWDNFALLGTPSSIYCVGSDGQFGTRQSSCTTPNINGKYTRSITLVFQPVDSVETMQVTSLVAWGDDLTNPSHRVQLTTYLTQWR